MLYMVQQPAGMVSLLAKVSLQHRHVVAASSEFGNLQAQVHPGFTT